MKTQFAWVGIAVLAAPLTTIAAESSPGAADNTPATNAVPRHPLLDHRFRFTAGGLYAASTTAARLDANTGLGATVNFEDGLGLEDRNLIVETSFRWRFASRWRLDIDYFSINRTATRTLSEQIEWGDEIFTAGTTVDSQFKISDLRASVGYSFFKRTDKDLGIGLGVHIMGLKTSLDASGLGADAADVSAPLPVLMTYYNVALTDTWALSTRIDWLSLSYDDYDGEIRAVAVDILYNPWPHVGFGFGWHSLTINLGLDATDWRGRVYLSNQGPALFMTASF